MRTQDTNAYPDACTQDTDRAHKTNTHTNLTNKNGTSILKFYTCTHTPQEIAHDPRSQGFSGADLASLLREAAMCALRADIDAERRFVYR